AGVQPRRRGCARTSAIELDRRRQRLLVGSDYGYVLWWRCVAVGRALEIELCLRDLHRGRACTRTRRRHDGGYRRGKAERLRSLSLLGAADLHAKAHVAKRAGWPLVTMA